MRREAEASVAARRSPELAALRTEPSRPGVFAWAGGPPAAGESAVLAYNKASGPLRPAPTCLNFGMSLGWFRDCLQQGPWAAQECAHKERLSP